MTDKKSTNEYNQYYNKVGKVKELGKDWKLYHIKNLCNTYQKIHIKDLKRIFIKKNVSKESTSIK